MNSLNGTRNRLLALMSPAARDRLAPSLEAIELDASEMLEAPGEMISHVYFVESGLVSIVGTAPQGHGIEIGMVGYEGMSGVGIVLGDDRSPNETMVQSAGSALRVSTRSLREAMAASPSLASTLLHYAHVVMIQSGQTALANGRGRLDERLARWLLMWDDRVRPDFITVTHEFLALLLGVRRPGLTDTMNDLEGRGLIRSSRGKVLLLNREGLKLVANGFSAAGWSLYRSDLASDVGSTFPTAPADDNLAQVKQALQQEHEKAEQLARELAAAWRALRSQATAMADNAAQDQQLTDLRQALQQTEASAAAYREMLAQERARNQDLQQQLAVRVEASPDRGSNAGASLSEMPGRTLQPTTDKQLAVLPANGKPMISAENTPATMAARFAVAEVSGIPEAPRLMARASLLLSQGNIGTARIVLERGAPALFALAETYDPTTLAAWGTFGTQGDVARAQELYAKALAGGVLEAKDRLNALR